VSVRSVASCRAAAPVSPGTPVVAHLQVSNLVLALGQHSLAHRAFF